MTPDLHPDLTPLAFLLGTWKGTGAGEYPTIESFSYVEEVTIGHVGKPFLIYTQRTRHADTNLPLHAEAGYFRPGSEGKVELILAQPSGIVEIQEGPLTGQTLDLRAQLVGTSTSAKEVKSVARFIEVDGDTMRYRVEMGAVGQPHQHHLAASLERTS